MKIHHPDIDDKVHTLWKNGNQPGYKTGFTCLDPYYTVQLGNTTYISGYPTVGKSQFTFQLQCNLTNLYDWKHVIYSPETGNVEDIYAELVHCLTGKTLDKTYANYISEKELFDALAYIKSFFKVIDQDDKPSTLESWYECVKELHKEFNIKTASIDNWNDIEHEISKRGNIISEYLKLELPKFNTFAKKLGIHGFMLIHPKNPQLSGKEPPPPPTPFMLEGGSLWPAKGRNIIILHRDLMDYKNTVVDVVIHKVKPKIVGKKGNIQLHFAPAFNCYFEEIDGRYVYPETSFKINGRPKDYYQ